MLALLKSVLKEIVLIALLQNESLNKYLILRVVGQDPNSSRRYLMPLDGAAYLKYWPLWGSNFPYEVLGKSTLFLYFWEMIFDFSKIYIGNVFVFLSIYTWIVNEFVMSFNIW